MQFHIDKVLGQELLYLSGGENILIQPHAGSSPLCADIDEDPLFGLFGIGQTRPQGVEPAYLAFCLALSG